MSKADERIARLRAEADKALERAKKKAAEVAALERRLRTQETAEERKRDTRRKILIGAMHLELATKHQDRKEKLRLDLEQYLTRDDDRLLFDLAPLAPKTPEAGEEPGQ